MNCSDCENKLDTCLEQGPPHFEECYDQYEECEKNCGHGTDDPEEVAEDVEF